MQLLFLPGNTTNRAFTIQISDAYFVEVTASGNSSGAFAPMLIKVTVVKNTPKANLIMIR